MTDPELHTRSTRRSTRRSTLHWTRCPWYTQPLSALSAFPGSLSDCSHQVWPAAHSSGWGCSTFHIRKRGRRGRLGGQRGGFFNWSKREKKKDLTTRVDCYSCKTAKLVNKLAEDRTYRVLYRKLAEGQRPKIPFFGTTPA